MGHLQVGRQLSSRLKMGGRRTPSNERAARETEREITWHPEGPTSDEMGHGRRSGSRDFGHQTSDEGEGADLEHDRPQRFPAKPPNCLSLDDKNKTKPGA